MTARFCDTIASKGIWEHRSSFIKRKRFIRIFFEPKKPVLVKLSLEEETQTWGILSLIQMIRYCLSVKILKCLQPRSDLNCFQISPLLRAWCSYFHGCLSKIFKLILDLFEIPLLSWISFSSYLLLKKQINGMVLFRLK